MFFLVSVVEKVNDEEIRTQLESRGIVFEEDSDFTTLLTSIKSEISSRIGIPFSPTSQVQLERSFNRNILVVDFYPLHEVTLLQIGNTVLVEGDDFIVDKINGIIYLEDFPKGFLKLEYSYCLTDEQLDIYVLPLLLDMCEYAMDSGWDKDASSIKEGEITVSFDTSVGKGALIQSRLNDLKSQFGIMGRMI